MFLDITWASINDNAKNIQWTDNGGTANQEWQFKPATINTENMARYVKFIGDSEVNGGPWTTVAELNLLVDGNPISQSGWSIVAVSSEETVAEDGAAMNAIDGDVDTIWHTEWSAQNPKSASRN